MAKPKHLKLVVSGVDAGKGSGRGNRGHQLAFPYPEVAAVFFVNVASAKVGDFENVVREFVPRWIFDVRAVPRLDGIAPSRRSAFALFERAKASYIDLFGRLGINSYRSVESNPAFWGKAVVDLLNDTDKRGPFIFVFDNEEVLRAAERILPEIVQPTIGRTASFSQIDLADSRRAVPRQ